MANLETLTMGKDGFGANPQNINKDGRPKGSKNRSTILRELINLIEGDDAESNEIKINRAVILKAISGDVAAYKEIQDTLYGKIPDKVLTAETNPQDLERDVTAEALKHVPTEELEKILQSNVTNGSEDCDDNV